MEIANALLKRLSKSMRVWGHIVDWMSVFLCVLLEQERVQLMS